MVIGRLTQEGDRAHATGSAWEQVIAAQRQSRLPCLLVPQPAHAVVAGELAAGLTCFGELPSEIQRAIQMHDTGWAGSDAQQIQRLRSGGPHAGHTAPVSFVDIPPAEVEEAWTASIHAVETFSKLGAAVVSRHFSLLAQHDKRYQRFLRAESSRWQRLEGESNRLGDAANDFHRWTAALGFCDLVSLYLLSGLSREVDFPLAHPASAQAQTAPRVKMQIEVGKLRFTPQAVRAGSVLSIQALKHPAPSQGPRAETLTWEVQ
jgi:Protein of unknown function (DUF3891)